MLSFLLNLPGDLGFDPATGQVTGEKVVKKVTKKVVKKVTKAAVDAALDTAQTAADAIKYAAKVASGGAAASASEAVNDTPPTPAAAAAVPVDDTPSPIVEFLTSLDPVMTSIVIGLLALIAFYIYRRRFSATGQVGDTFLILGAMSSGKTCLFYQMKQGLHRETLTSMKENDATFVPKGLEGKLAPYRYVDLPGHASQRVKLDQLKSVSKGVIFVVDATSPETFGKVAQFLYTLLVDHVFTARRTPFFIAINKKDRLSQSSTAVTDDEEEETASEIDQIAQRLEKILDKTRSLQSTMSDLGSDSETRVGVLGRQGEEFHFADSICPISYGGISAAKGEVQDLLDFLQAQ